MAELFFRFPDHLHIRYRTYTEAGPSRLPPLPDNPQELFDAQLAFIQAAKDVYSEDVIRVFKNLDFGFTSFEIPSSVEEAKAVKAWTTHNVYDENGKVIGNKRFPMKTSELE